MKIIKHFWQNFKNEPDIWFFYGFLLTFTLSIRKIIYFYLIKGNFNEYSAISLYLSDVFLILTIIFWLISILCNNITVLSIFKSPIHSLSLEKVWITCWERLKCSTLAPWNVPRGTFFTGWNILNRKLLLIPILLVAWTFLSIAWSDNKIIALYRSAKFLEFYLLYIYVIYKIINSINVSDVSRLPREIKMFHVEHFNFLRGGTFFTGWNILKHIFWIIIFLGLFQSAISIWQFIIQHSIGLFWLKESLISPEILGVAKVVFGSQKYIRAYGLFPHPNILGGFLLFSIVLTLLYRKLFHVEHSIQSRTIWWLIIAIQIFAIILTFSKSALIGLIIALTYIFIHQYKNAPRLPREFKIVPRGTILNFYGVEHFKRYFILSLFIFGLLLFYFKIDLYSLFIRSLEERFVYLVISLKAIVSHIFSGLGNGQFVLEMQKYASQSLEFWQFQPVHNVFLLILSELGIIGLFLFIWLLLELFPPVKLRHGTSVEQLEKQKRELRLNNYYTILSIGLILPYFKAILLGFIFIMLFDHYFWDIQQGQIMFWIVIGIIAGLNIKK